MNVEIIVQIWTIGVGAAARKDGKLSKGRLRPSWVNGEVRVMADGRSTLQQSLMAAARFLEWWRDELWGMVPAGFQQLSVGSKPKIVIAVLDTGFQVLLDNGRGTSTPVTAEGAAPTLSEALLRLDAPGISRRPRIAGLRLSIEACYQRVVELPAAARDDFRKILSFYLQRATPFPSLDAYMAHLVYS